MAYQKKTDTPRKKAPSAPRLSNIVKPRGMSLEGWQTVLRRQAARKENFGIVEVDTEHSPGEYLVISPATGQASIRIPVSDKESVLQFVSLLGKMLK